MPTLTPPNCVFPRTRSQPSPVPFCILSISPDTLPFLVLTGAGSPGALLFLQPLRERLLPLPQSPGQGSVLQTGRLADYVVTVRKIIFRLFLIFSAGEEEGGCVRGLRRGVCTEKCGSSPQINAGSDSYVCPDTCTRITEFCMISGNP